jgi:hypothetical protein
VTAIPLPRPKFSLLAGWKRHISNAFQGASMYVGFAISLWWPQMMELSVWTAFKGIGHTYASGIFLSG